MSSAFQLSSAYRPYRPPLTESSTIVAGMAIRTAATSSFPAQPRANVAESASEQQPASSAASRSRPDVGEGGWSVGAVVASGEAPVWDIVLGGHEGDRTCTSACGRAEPTHKDTLLTMSATAPGVPSRHGLPMTGRRPTLERADLDARRADVVIVTFDTAQILDVTGPLEVFSSASRFLPAVRYRTQVVTTRGGPVRASCGLEFASSPITDVTGPVDTLMVAGGADMDAAVADTELLAQVRRLATDARRVTSVCSGAFVLAAAGLLEGRRATTHWAECGLLDDTYADVTVDPDAIYVHDGNVWTSAGVTAGIDLALALVADDHGHQAAATVARQLVVYLQRSGGQAQFSALLAGQAADTEPVRDLLSWLRDHLTDDLSVAALARQINLSERQFTRVFKAEVGATAADHVEAVRLESACRLLETTNRTIEQIAKTCGFGTPETMNRTFRRRLDTTPGEHRHHFRGDIPVPIATP